MTCLEQCPYCGLYFETDSEQEFGYCPHCERDDIELYTINDIELHEILDDDEEE